MSFEYNIDLDLNQRIKQVSEEIINRYPLIEHNAAIMSATMSSSIDDKPTNTEKFERYYFLLMFLNKDNDEYIHVLNDMYDVYENGIEDDIYNRCFEEIINYTEHKRDTFPLLEEFY